MALTYLQLANTVIRRTSQTVLTDVTTATGTQQIVLDLLNECQTVLFNEADWENFYTTRTFSTVAGTATYALAADWGRTICLLDETNNRILLEAPARAFNEQDPNANFQSLPMGFAVVGTNYQLYPIPSAVATIRDKYYAKPTPMTVNASTTGFPIEAENCFIYYAQMGIFEYLGKIDLADRAKANYNEQLRLAKNANQRKIDRMHVMGGSSFGTPELAPVRMPPAYGYGQWL